MHLVPICDPEVVAGNASNVSYNYIIMSLNFLFELKGVLALFFFFTTSPPCSLKLNAILNFKPSASGGEERINTSCSFIKTHKSEKCNISHLK